MQISNTLARQILIEKQAFVGTATLNQDRRSARTVLDHLGFVQVDSIPYLARAHDHIMWSRDTAFRPNQLRTLVDKDRTAFESWTHDASILPMQTLPHWKHKFTRDAQTLERRWKNWHRGDFIALMDGVLDQISQNGATCSQDVGQSEQKSSGGWWDWHPSKTALEYLWRSGQVMVCHRQGFRKFFDLTENVVPSAILSQSFDWTTTLDWSCRAALQRLGFATPGEIAAFWDLARPQEVKAWVQQGLSERWLTQVEVQAAPGLKPYQAVSLTSDLDAFAGRPIPTTRTRILNPFDPMIRDRKRLNRLFGFDFRIEIFVPAAKRTYGYYVCPILEGSQFVGRIELRTRRDDKTLDVLGFWPTSTKHWGAGRLNRLRAEIGRMARFVGAHDILYHTDAGDALRWLASKPSERS